MKSDHMYNLFFMEVWDHEVRKYLTWSDASNEDKRKQQVTYDQQQVRQQDEFLIGGVFKTHKFKSGMHF